MPDLTIHQGDCLEMLRRLPVGSVHCCATSPPYFGLRDYGVDGQIGLEQSPNEYVAKLVEVFREVRRVLRDDGTLFLNIGDSYFGSAQTGGMNSKEGSAKRAGRTFTRASSAGRAQSYGNADKVKSDCQDCGCSYESPCDARKDFLANRIFGISPHLEARQILESCLKIRECMEQLSAHVPIADCVLPQRNAQSFQASLDLARSLVREALPLLASQASMLRESSLRLQGGEMRAASFSAFLSSLQSFAAYARLFAGMLGEFSEMRHCTDRSVLPFSELAHHIQCIVSCYSILFSYQQIRDSEPQGSTILKPKDLIGIPWMVAFALRADGWYLRQDIIWAKPNPMPESVTDRCTKSHEYIFLLSKSERYFYDADAVKEPAIGGLPGNRTKAGLRAYTFKRRTATTPPPGMPNQHREDRDEKFYNETRNKRSVWNVPTQPLKEAHFATFPPDLIKPCVLAGCPIGGTVLDPFAGSGTTGKVALELGRSAILCELNPDYIKLIEKRCRVELPLPWEVAS